MTVPTPSSATHLRSNPTRRTPARPRPTRRNPVRTDPPPPDRPQPNALQPDRPDPDPSRPSHRSGTAVAATVAAVLAIATCAFALLLARGAEREPGPALGAVLDADDRHALGATPLRRGSAAPPADPAVDPTDPEAVARGYLAAARSVGADDGGATQRRAAAYAVPGSPPAAVGVVVLDPPPRGQVRRARVTALDLLAADAAGLRRGYRATVSTTVISTTVTGTGTAGGGPPAPAPDATPDPTSTSYVVLARQPDGRWLVAQDTAVAADPLDADD